MRLEPELHPPAVELDDEGAGDLLDRCHLFIALMVERKLPKYLQSEGLRLLKELDEAQGWYDVH